MKATRKSSILRRLAKNEKVRQSFEKPTICNVIELFDVRPRNEGFMDHRIRAAFGELSPMVGFAATAAFRSDAPPLGGDAYGSLASDPCSIHGLYLGRPLSS